MGKVYDGIDERLAGWIARQRLFFVGTAPLAADGHVNVSPKGPIECLRVLGPRRIAYLDLVGSGAETIAHLRENGRIVVMLCAFDGPPRIVRLHGQGTVVQLGDAAFPELAEAFADAEIPAAAEAARSVITVEIERIADSCGYGVPRMRYEAERPQRPDWVDARLRKNGPEALLDYMVACNVESIDGLPAVEAAALPRA